MQDVFISIASNTPAKRGLRLYRDRFSTANLTEKHSHVHDIRAFFKVCFTVEIIWGSFVEAFHIQCILNFVLQILHESQQNHI